jgi:crotonobetainyl-CoA:carnitine CoA-transferase CaiB-like acyl-CoA transferase
LRFSGSPLSYAAPPPLLGEHSRGVLRDRLGVDDVALAGLVARGVVSVAPTRERDSAGRTSP